MAAGDELQGTRLPDAKMGEPGPGWDSWEGRDEAGRRTVAAAPGSYMKVTTDGPGIYWFIVDPRGASGTIIVGGAESRHSATEYADGTITVSPSIAPSDSNPGGWHGYLERGVWREV